MLEIILKRSYIKLSIIVLFSLIIDNLFISGINNPPAWDQGYHLSNTFKMYNILSDISLNYINKFDDLLNVTDSYRGPLTYFVSALFLKIFNNTYHFAYLSNQIFNIICIFSIFNLAKIIKNESTGVWASLIFTFSSFIIYQRSDFLIDLSLTSVSSLSLLFLTKWYFNENKNNFYSLLSGFSLGLVFLIKPTGIIIFLFSFITLLIKKTKKNQKTLENIISLFIFLTSFILIIFPWFSRHWLTIISSTVNAWNWGINYQEGLDINSVKGWLFYFYSLPKIFGIINFSIFSIIFIFEKILKRNFLIFNFKTLKKEDIWFLIFLLNTYLVLGSMSTKDIRFILPLYPIFCIYLSKFINSKSYKIFKEINKKLILIITIIISLVVSENRSVLKYSNRNFLYEWPHREIIEFIKNKNPNLTTTLAVLPDTKEINTFNLEAEASKQGEFISVRQIISNKNTYKEDLKYFDWFLLKTEDQGVMTNESKDLLNNYLLKNKSFITENKWILPDKSELMLLRRKKINTTLSRKDCDKGLSTINLKQINGGLNISFFSKGENIKSSNLLIDLKEKNFKYYINISLANGFIHNSFDEKSCYILSQDIPINFPKDTPNNLTTDVRLLNKNGQLENLNFINKQLTLNDELFNAKYIQKTNLIEKVENLGIYLKQGKFKDLFDLVGIINQSDAKQSYLKSAERIFIQRYKENKNLNDLYSLLITQILQRKISDAEKNINLILKIDSQNGNSFITKSIIEVYLLDKKNARISLKKSNKLEKSDESIEIYHILDGLISLLEMNFINAYKTFT
tara:strand:- start:2200 stop:4590 length:2391 start_codon:yes stop_codon:yes gene_type:complete